MNRDSVVYVAGHRGLVGAALERVLRARGFAHLVHRTHAELDLADRNAVNAFFAAEQPEYVFLAAALVGGIAANAAYPADFIRNNLEVQLSVIDAAYRHGVRKLMFLGSACIYPKLCPQPIREEYLLTGPLEPTNAPYAIAKIAGISLCQSYDRQYGANFVSVMPTNLYGPGDRFDLQNSHVLPALLRRLHEAKRAGVPSVTIWGTGTPRREFMHVDDMAGACVHLMEHYDSPEIINVGTGEDISIADLARRIQALVGYEGRLEFDPSKPDGTPLRRLDISRLLATGWTPSIGLDQGLDQTYRWYLENVGHLRS
ncbi:MAG: GDP-L-fucose synthase [Gemmatimonadota bacterium]|nr:GDP-L-fucose synthase [Gemmatimonadota bacterium]MDE3127335.1 GDP-L-fucose synthase [Gemmatimonadota bacterium]MDE3172461.1 GDP-L-fucose synthase [Gemmatimonadota bacterium]MDE3215814.1 GDP-L-fucose synthase [Gemmatimonadota bacterium]